MTARRRASPGRVTSTTSSREPPVELRPLELRAPCSRRPARGARAARSASCPVSRSRTWRSACGSSALRPRKRTRAASSSSAVDGSRDRALRLGFEDLGVHAAETTIGPVVPQPARSTPAPALRPDRRLYDDWSRRVTEDVDFYVEEAAPRRAARSSSSASARGGSRSRPRGAGVRVIGVDSSRRDARRLPAARGSGRRRGPARPAPRRSTGGRRSTSASGSSPARSARTSTSGPTTSELDALRAALALLEPGGRLVFDVFAPSDADIAETHGRWLEREPGIWERADWRPEDTPARPLGARRERRDDDGARLAARRSAGASCSCAPASSGSSATAGSTAVRYRGGEDTVWIAERPG